jgi:hypothetical protein
LSYCKHIKFVEKSRLFAENILSLEQVRRKENILSWSDAGSTKNKKQDTEVGTSSSAPAEPSIEELLNRLEELDNTIEVISISNENLRSEISTINTTLAINRNILESKTESHDSFQTKYNDIVAKHGTCFKSS